MIETYNHSWFQRYIQSRIVAPVVISFSYLAGGIGFAKLVDAVSNSFVFTGIEWITLCGAVGFVTILYRAKHDTKVKDWEAEIERLTDMQRKSEDVTLLMSDGFNVLLDGYLMQVLQQLGKGDPACRITLFTYDSVKNTFKARGRYSRNPNYRRIDVRDYLMEGFLQLVWTQKGTFFQCTGQTRGWHTRKGLPQSSYDILALKGKLYSGIRVDVDSRERAILLLESESHDLWTESEFNVIFGEQEMNFLTTLVRIGFDHFDINKLAKEIDNVL